jgi:hypothetical protein
MPAIPKNKSQTLKNITEQSLEARQSIAGARRNLPEKNQPQTRQKTPIEHTGQDHRTQIFFFFFSLEGVPVSIKQEQKEKLL